MNAALWICVPLLLAAMAMTLYSIERGPTSMDRAISVDVLTSSVIGLLLVLMAMQNRTDLLALVVVLSAIGFVSTTTISRFSQKEDRPTPVESSDDFDDDAAPVHGDERDDEAFAQLKADPRSEREVQQ